MQWLIDWCRTNNLSLNADKTKEMVVDLRRVEDHSALNINLYFPKILGDHMDGEPHLIPKHQLSRVSTLYEG